MNITTQVVNIIKELKRKEIEGCYSKEKGKTS
jgi:ABC-type arginine transport system ATPase subunit